MSTTASASWQTSESIYFFLSYAHSPPTVDPASTDSDPWVTAFFDDLCAEVGQLARPDTKLGIGFYDDLLPPGSDWKALSASALGAAEVFVPLYSPGYLNRSWPIRERESYRRRLAVFASAGTGRHILPVLWVPLPAWDEAPERADALEIAKDIPEYADNGLRALCRIGSYRRHYVTILERLAKRIVAVAEKSPLGPSPAVALDRLPVPPATDTPFVIAVLAPSGSDAPALPRKGSYGPMGTSWRPFADTQELPAAEYVANVAERLGLPTRIVDLAAGGTLLDTYPCVLLIDPWVVAGKDSTAVLSEATGHLHEWVTPLIVVDQDDVHGSARGAVLAAEVTDTLARAGAVRVKRARQVNEFVELIPTLISEARRQYLKHGPVFPPKGPHRERPRLAGPDVSNDPALGK